MMTDKQHILADSELYREAEIKTNRDNVRYLIILTVILLLCNALNEIKIFNVSPLVMRIGATLATIILLIPVLVLMRPLKLYSRCPQKLVYRKWHKYLIITFSWCGTAVACVTFTHHTVIAMAMPIMLMAQYRSTKKLVYMTMLFGTLCVLLGVYGGYFLGCFDGNLLHLAITDENAADLALRARTATPERMIDLFSHYVLGREFVVLALILLASKISERSNEMLERQAELQLIAEREMKKKSKIQWQIIDGMANLIENRDSSTGEHVKRSSFYVKRIVASIKSTAYNDELSERTADNIVRAAPLHDIGKIIVADRILQKPGRLTPEEYEEIKLHASEGARVIKNVLGNIEDEDFLRIASEIAAYHHERWDGKGYPEGLSGKNIPLPARIMAVADVFDALVSERVYKKAMMPEDAFAVIKSEAGKQFDPEVVRAFIGLKPEILQVLAETAQRGYIK